MRERGILQLHRADPLAAGLDHVLGPIGQGDLTVVVDHGHVAGH
jgi:hypothetical protein